MDEGDLLGSYISGVGKRRRISAKVKAAEQFAPDKEMLIETDNNLAKAKEDDADIGGYLERCLRHLWQAVEDNRVLLSFAIAGYDYESGQPVYDYDVLIDLIASYGYNIDVALMFASEFGRSKWPDGSKRIVMNSAARIEMHTAVKPLPDNPCN